MTTQTVDALLRARSDANLSSQLDGLLAPIYALITQASGIDADAADGLVADLKAQIFALIAPSFQQAEINAFLSNVTTQTFVTAS